MLNLSIRNIRTDEQREYRNVLALYIAPKLNEVSFCISIPSSSSISEVQRFDLNEWEILCN